MNLDIDFLFFSPHASPLHHSLTPPWLPAPSCAPPSNAYSPDECVSPLALAISRPSPVDNALSRDSNERRALRKSAKTQPQNPGRLEFGNLVTPANLKWSPNHFFTARRRSRTRLSPHAPLGSDYPRLPLSGLKIRRQAGRDKHEFLTRVPPRFFPRRASSTSPARPPCPRNRRQSHRLHRTTMTSPRASRSKRNSASNKPRFEKLLSNSLPAIVPLDFEKTAISCQSRIYEPLLDLLRRKRSAAIERSYRSLKLRE